MKAIGYNHITSTQKNNPKPNLQAQLTKIVNITLTI